MIRDRAPRLSLTSAGFALLGFLILSHFVWIVLNAVDIPEWDEWGMLGGLTMAKNHRFVEWLTMLHNEHEIIPTKLQVWLSYRLTGWNITLNLALNYLIYCALPLGFLGWVIKRWPAVPRGPLALLTLFSFSTLNHENFLWSLQSCFHFALLFSFLGSLLLFSERQKWSFLLAGAACLTASIFSLASGAAMALVALILFSFFKGQRFREADRRGSRELTQWAVVSGIVLAGAVTFLTLLRHSGSSPSSRSIRWGALGNYFFNLLSLGFGVTQLSAGIGVICLAAVVFPFYRLWRDPGVNRRADLWVLTAWASSILGALLAIAVGRSGTFPVALAKSSRYSEIALPLIAITATAWALAWREKAQWCDRGLFLLCAAMFCTFLNDWNFGLYPTIAERRRASVDCVARYFTTGVVETCPTVSPAPIPFHFDQARDLGVSFYRRLKH